MPYELIGTKKGFKVKKFEDADSNKSAFPQGKLAKELFKKASADLKTTAEKIYEETERKAKLIKKFKVEEKIIDKCVICGRKIDPCFIGEEVVCADYCKGILTGKIDALNLVLKRIEFLELSPADNNITILKVGIKTHLKQLNRGNKDD